MTSDEGVCYYLEGAFSRTQTKPYLKLSQTCDLRGEMENLKVGSINEKIEFQAIRVLGINLTEFS